MIIEHAVLNVIEGKRDAFEAAFAKAMPLISETPGFIGLELRPCIEADGKYLLLVQWRSVEDHTTGFRRTSRYDEWRRLLHHYYAPFPDVLHFGPARLSC
jgi:heme-degrading monooxygenase HmoA